MTGQLLTALIGITSMLVFSCSNASESNYVLSVEGDMLRSYSLAGQLITEIKVDQVERGLASPADIIQFGDSKIAIVEGRSTLVGGIHGGLNVRIYDGLDNSWKHFSALDWGIAPGDINKGVAVKGEYAYVVDQLGSTLGQNGLLQFNLETGESTHLFIGRTFDAIVLGLDGELYISEVVTHDIVLPGEPSINTAIYKVDIDTMQTISRVLLPRVNGRSDFSIDTNGDIYQLQVFELNKYDSDGDFIDSFQVPTSATGGYSFSIVHFDLAMDGKIVMSGFSSRYICLTNTSFIEPSCFDDSEVTFLSPKVTLTDLDFENLPHADVDRDGVDDYKDNCNGYNPDQADENDNGVGDRCELDILDFLPAIISAQK